LKRRDQAKSGRVVETRGRRVMVEDGAAREVCFLSGQRAVIGDRVRWVEAEGGGGKLVEVMPRTRALARVDRQGREQVLAANLGGLMVVAACQQPPLRGGLLDRYAVAARVAGLEMAVAVSKIDLGIPPKAEQALALRRSAGIVWFGVSPLTGEGLDAIAEFLAEQDDPWALVGHSGVGKTSLVAALDPEADVGAIGALSEYWGRGQHTTSHSRIFRLPGGGEVIDSPGIRTFAPAGLEPETVTRHFPGFEELRCRYRDCRHREGEDGCEAPEAIDPVLLKSYRRLLQELEDIGTRAHRKRPRR
jgi:ribosome biogenesis GTPase / thiamine phosphate phosphatase